MKHSVCIYPKGTYKINAQTINIDLRMNDFIMWPAEGSIYHHTREVFVVCLWWHDFIQMTNSCFNTNQSSKLWTFNQVPQDEKKLHLNSIKCEIDMKFCGAWSLKWSFPGVYSQIYYNRSFTSIMWNCFL